MLFRILESHNALFFDSDTDFARVFVLDPEPLWRRSPKRDFELENDLEYIPSPNIE